MASFKMKKKTAQSGFSRALKGGLRRLAVNAPKELRQHVIGVLLGRILPEFYPADKVLHPNNLIEVVGATYLAIPPEWRFVVHEVVEGAIDTWLPEDSPLKHALHDAISITHFATEAFLSRNDLTDEIIRAHLGPTLEERFTHYQTHGGHMAHDATHPKPPSFFAKKFEEALPVLVAGAKRIFTGKNAEIVADESEKVLDKIENVAYPAMLWTFRMGFSLPVFAAALLLGAVTVPTIVVQTLFLNEYAIAFNELSGFEIARRTFGFLLNVTYQITVPMGYLVVALLVASPFLGIRRRPDGTWTWWRPTRPEDPLPGSEPPGVTLEEHKANRLRDFENDDDGWREAFRESLFLRAGIIIVTLVVGTILVAMGGMVALIPTYQHLTLLQYLVISIVSFHILWLGDDLANAVRTAVTEKPEGHAPTAGGDGHGHDETHEEQLRSTVKRLRKIMGTLTLIVTVAGLTYLVAIELSPWLWAVGTLLVTYLMLALAVFLVSRMLFGDSWDAPNDLREDSAKQRRFAHKTVAAILGFGGVTVFAVSMLTSVVFHGYGWVQDCKGYEETAQCSLFANGYGEYVDSQERWGALRDRSAKSLTKRTKPVGNACIIATKKVDFINTKYQTSVLSGPDVVADDDGVCESLASDVELRKRFPKWAKTCAEQRVECEKG